MVNKYNKYYMLSEHQLWELGAWLFSEGFWSALDNTKKDTDPYGSKRRDCAVQKVINKLK